MLRASILLASLARIASAFSIPQPGDPIPGSSPALAGAPRPDRTAGRAAPTRPLRRSLCASVMEGAFAEVFAACATGAVITGWALYLGASPAIIGVLGALPLGAQILNLPAAWFINASSRKAVTVCAVTVSRLSFLPLVALPWLPLATAAKLHLFLGIVAFGTIVAVIGNSAWVAWMGDLVPSRLRGQFFGRRTILLSITGTLASITSAVTLDRVAPHGWTGAGLAILTAIACVAGLISLVLLLRQHEPRVSGQADVPGWRALRGALGDLRARPFIYYQLAWNGAVGISASFFAYHLLVNLRTGFLVVAAHGVMVATVRIVSARLWGRAVDRIGARPVLVFCSFGISLIPAIWLLTTPERLWPIALEALVSGSLWAGHGIAAMDLSIDLAPRRARPFYLAAFACAGGVGFSVASVLAGQLAARLPAHFVLAGQWWTAIHVLFLCSAIGRLGAAVLSLNLQDPGARGGVPELVRSFADQVRAAIAHTLVPDVRLPAFARLPALARRRAG